MKLKKNKKGSLIIIILWILTVLVLLSVSLNYRMGLKVKLASLSRDSQEAYYLAKAGIERAILAINTDKEEKVDTLTQCGISLNEEAGETPGSFFKDIPLGSGSFSVAYEDENGKLIYGAADEERKINVNKVVREKIMGGGPDEKFKELLKELFDYAEIPSPENLTGVLIDWIDEDSNSIFGSDADDTDYVKNAPLDFTEEFLNILEYFYYREKNYTKTKAKQEALSSFSKLKDLITVYGSGKVNINTAGPRVLSILGMDKDLIEDIISFRGGFDSEEEPGFFVQAAKAADILLYPPDYEGPKPSFMDINDPKYKQFLTTKSSAFKIYSSGKLANGKMERNITCIIKRGVKKGSSILRYWRDF